MNEHHRGRYNGPHTPTRSQYAGLVFGVTLTLGLGACGSPDDQEGATEAIATRNAPAPASTDTASSPGTDTTSGSTSGAADPEPSSEPISTVSTSIDTEAAVNGEGEVHEEGDGHDHSVLGGEDMYTNIPNTVWDAETQALAEAAASRALAAFLDAEAGYDVWWAGYAPLLESSYAAEAQYIDPERIDLGTVGPPKVQNPELNPIRTAVMFQTSAGPWEMVLTRKGDTSPWLVAAFSSVTP